jgi:hypothetical protein
MSSLAIATNCLIVLREVTYFEHVAYQPYSAMLAIIDHQALCTDLFLLVGCLC